MLISQKPHNQVTKWFGTPSSSKLLIFIKKKGCFFSLKKIAEDSTLIYCVNFDIDKTERETVTHINHCANGAMAWR